MTGLPASWTVELYLGAWVDVTAWHVGESSTSLHFGRNNAYSDIGTGTCSFALRNEDGRFTPRSTTSPYTPHVKRGIPVRLSGNHGTGAVRVFTGTADNLAPTWPDRGLAGGIVTLSCTDLLADLEKITFVDRWTEEARAIARAGSTWCDIPALTGDSSAITLDNDGVTTTTLGTCTVSGPPSFSSPQGLTLARSFTTTAGSASSIWVATQGAVQSANFWINLPTDVLPVITSAGGYVAIVGGVIIGVKMLDASTGIVDLVLGVGSGLPTILADVADGAWRHIAMRPVVGTPTTTLITVSDTTGAVVATYTAAADMRGTSAGFGSHTMTFAGIVLSGAAVGISTIRGLATGTDSLSATYAALQSYTPTVTSWALTGAEDPTIGEPTWAGRTPAAVLQQLARTVQGIGWCRPDGTIELITDSVANPVVPVVTLQTEQDLDASVVPTWADAGTEQPTRVVVSYATGATTVVNTTDEATGRRQEGPTVNTCAASVADAQTVGQAALAASDALRVSQLGIDLYASVQDVWAAFLGLFPTQLLGTSPWPVQMTGGTTDLDIAVQGWGVDISEEAWRYTLDCSPGGIYPGAAWDHGIWDDAAAIWRA